MTTPLGPARNSVGIREMRADGVRLDGAMVLDVIGGGLAYVASTSTTAAKYVLTLSAGVTFATVKAALAAATTAIDVAGQKITGLGTPEASTDAATMGYVDAATTNVPSAGEKAALVGTSGTPGSGNKYVTNADPRNTDARTPTSHAASHTNGTDQIANASGAAAGLMTAAQFTKLAGIETAADVTDFANVSAALAAASGAVSVNGQTVTSGGFIAPYFTTNSTPRAASGLLRGSSAQVLVAGRDDGDSVDVALVSFGIVGTDVAQYGDASVERIFLSTKATGSCLFDTKNVALFTNAENFGSGQGVIYIANASVAPTTNPTGGGILYCEAGALKFRGSAGTVSTIAPA